MSQSLMRFFVWVPFHWDMFHVSQTFCFSFGLVREPLVFSEACVQSFLQTSFGLIDKCCLSSYSYPFFSVFLKFFSFFS